MIRVVSFVTLTDQGVREIASGRAAVTSLIPPARPRPRGRSRYGARTPAHFVEVARRLPSSRKGNLDAMPHDPLEGVRQVRRELAAAIRVAADCRARVLEERPE